MECNKEEARRAMNIAEMKLCEKDYNGAKKFINKAQNMYPTLDGLKQVLMMIDVYISASNKNNGGGESDWCGILGVHPSADDETLKKQYKNLARLLHPDKNRFHGAECAFKLVLDAWSLLSDKAKRIAYDQKRKPIQVQHEPEPASSSSKPPEKVTVSTVCNRCTTRYAPFLSNNHINKTFPCPNCGQDSAISTEMINGTLYVRFSFPLQKEEQSSASSQATRENSTRHTSSSTSAASKTTQGRGKRFFEEYSREKLAATTARGNSNEAEKLLKKLMTTTSHANSTDEARRLFKNLTETTADANSTDEAKRLFKKP